MPRDFAQSFYNSKRWKNTRNAYMKSVSNLCEKCRAAGLIVPAEIVHHKVHIEPDTINDPNVSLSWDNLEALCRNCHAAQHETEYNKNKTPKRYRIDENGNVIL